MLAGLVKAENIDLTDLRGIAGGSGRKAVGYWTCVSLSTSDGWALLEAGWSVCPYLLLVRTEWGPLHNTVFCLINVACCPALGLSLSAQTLVDLTERHNFYLDTLSKSQGA